MILKQYYLGCLAHASYLIADEDSGLAAVVDPQRDVDQYLSDAVSRHDHKAFAEAKAAMSKIRVGQQKQKKAK